VVFKRREIGRASRTRIAKSGGRNYGLTSRLKVKNWGWNTETTTGNEGRGGTEGRGPANRQRKVPLEG